MCHVHLCGTSKAKQDNPEPKKKKEKMITALAMFKFYKLWKARYKTQAESLITQIEKEKANYRYSSEKEKALEKMLGYLSKCETSLKLYQKRRPEAQKFINYYQHEISTIRDYIKESFM